MTAKKRMADNNFFDTNILVYAVAKNDPRASISEKLLASGGLISVQSLNEFVAIARRKLDMSWEAIKQFLDAICILCPDPVPITLGTHKLALAIADKYDYGIYDSLIMAAALDSGCAMLYSEDLQDGQVIRQQLTIRNPFR